MIDNGYWKEDMLFLRGMEMECENGHTWMFLVNFSPILLFVESLDRRRVYRSVKYDGKGGRNVLDLKDIF
jgi:hypothetical protein